MRLVDSLSDDNLARLNAYLPWETWTPDASGRRVGNPAGRQYPLGGALVAIMEREFTGLSDYTAAEFGAYEGAHTIGLADRCARVIALEGRFRNLLCGSTRAAFYGVGGKIEWRLADVELCELPEVDVALHSGVLYHLTKPEGHLDLVCRKVRLGLVLDTHHTGENPPMEKAEKVTASKDGLRQLSLWLPRATILAVLERHFTDVRVLSDREEPHGLRFTVVAKGRRNG
jgi:tRNA (mo5U34)-methyltransferase